MPHLHPVCPGQQVGADARVVGVAGVVVLGDETCGLVGAEELQHDVGRAAGVDHVVALAVDDEAEQVLLAEPADRRRGAPTRAHQQLGGDVDRGPGLRVHPRAGDEGLVQRGQHLVGLRSDAARRPLGGKEVQHDRLGVEARAVDLVGAVAAQDVVPRRRGVPVVGWPGHRADHDVLVPLDAAVRVLVLVCQPDRMPPLVRRRPAIEEAEVHRRLVQRDLACVGADVRPRAVARVEGDADVGIRRIVEDQLQVGHVGPPAGLLACGRALCRVAADEPRVQRAAVHPGLADRRNAAHAAASGAPGALRTHQLERQDAVEADVGAVGHGRLLVPSVVERRPAGRRPAVASEHAPEGTVGQVSFVGVPVAVTCCVGLVSDP